MFLCVLSLCQYSRGQSFSALVDWRLLKSPRQASIWISSKTDEQDAELLYSFTKTGRAPKKAKVWVYFSGSRLMFD